ncbi:MAG TPA: serine protease [Prolixibacteraceae bacterium]|nr:serine protease [Prolixibacteraceae bacterium]
MMCLFCSMVSLGQVRVGWRSIFDKEGRLSRMNYYDNGLTVIDSNMFFQYYTDNVLKAFVNGEIKQQTGKITGRVAHFDYNCNLTDYSTLIEGDVLFDISCDYEQRCKAFWSDSFSSLNKQWECSDINFFNNKMILKNSSLLGYAIFNPTVPININDLFSFSIDIPVEGNSAKQGIAFGWKDADNFLLYEVSFGKYFNVFLWENGEQREIGGGRNEIESPGEIVNSLVLKNNGKTLLLEVNGKLESIIPTPHFSSNKIALVTRSKGESYFSNFLFTNDIDNQSAFHQNFWIGKGTGFFITPKRILTTFDVVSDAKRLRVKGMINGNPVLLSAKLLRVDEANNLALIEIEDPDFKAFDQLPFGYSDIMPVSDSEVFSIGFSNAISGVYMAPEVYQGKVLPSSMSVGYRLLEMPFRFGMIGSPVFDKDANLIGVCAYKGLELKYTEIVDFYDNSRLFKVNLGAFDRKLESPLKGIGSNKITKSLSEIVVIIESSIFDF